MQRHKVRFLTHGRRNARSQQRGVALITTLLLLMLMSGLALAMAWSTRSDMLINGYYRSFRGSFYAADSGLNIARQEIQNQVMKDIVAGWNGTSVTPFANPGQTATNVDTYIQNTYAAYTKLNGSGQATSSWPADYKIQKSVVGGVTQPFVKYVGCTMADGSACAFPVTTYYKYQFDYSLTSIGQSRGGEAATMQDRGSFFVTAPLSAAGGKTSFAAWGMFIDNFPICTGGTLVPGTITGPVFTNGAWTFGTGGPYTFTDPVGSVSSSFGYQFGGKNNCDQTANPTDKQGNTSITPNFQAGFNLGQSKIALPGNDYDQERAVLDGIGVSGGSPISKQDLNKGLLDINGVAYPNSGATSGVFLPYTTKDALGNTIPPKFVGGGIYVEGNANITLQPVGTSAQLYTITQGSTITTITVDPIANTTTMVTGGTAQVITGVPTQLDPTTLVPKGYETMLYVNGNVNSLSGPGEGLPAIQDHTALTITAASNVTITGDIRYKAEPVTTAATNTTPIDTLIPANDTRQALGIFTASGDIQLNNGQADGMLQIDGSLATISNNGTGGIVNTGNAIDTLTIVGGRIQNNIKNINTTTRNVVFDKRFGGGFAPPWFPSTNLAAGAITPGTPVGSFSRLQWINRTPFD